MNRRDVIKGLGLSFGYAVATPTMFSLLQGCKTESHIWVPKFLTIDESIVLRNLVDLILPKTEATPGALDVNVPEFIDLFAYKAFNEDEAGEFKIGMISIMNALNIYEKGPSELKTEDYDALLAKYLKTDEDQQAAFMENETDATIFETLVNIRGMSIWAYKTSEQIGEHVLAYDPIPGRQQGCVSLEEATGGKAWSL